MRIRCLCASLLLIAWLPEVRLGAEYLGALPDVVPVDRLVANLERLIAAEPKDAVLRINLARSHAMAYARKVDRVGRSPDGDRGGVATRDPSPLVPFGPVVEAPNATAQERARVHLRSAIAAYESALALDPTQTVARLGYGWCLEQAGERDRAIAVYRAVIAESWPREQRTRVIEHGTGATMEAARYLIPLLDQVRDSAEIVRLRGYLAEMTTWSRFISPIVVPLSEGLSVDALVDRTRQVRFDADGTGPSDWSWISPNAGWLFFDHEGHGRIDSALQLFGNVTFWMFWRNGYEVLRALDDNQDGSLTGDELTGLALWHDENSNGVSEHGEVKPLADWGIVSVSSRHLIEDESDDYIAWSVAGVTFADGTTRPTYDVLLHKATRQEQNATTVAVEPSRP